jgi:hypothetical protein
MNAWLFIAMTIIQIGVFWGLSENSKLESKVDRLFGAMLLTNAQLIVFYILVIGGL